MAGELAASQNPAVCRFQFFRNCWWAEVSQADCGVLRAPFPPTGGPCDARTVGQSRTLAAHNGRIWQAETITVHGACMVLQPWHCVSSFHFLRLPVYCLVAAAGYRDCSKGYCLVTPVQQRYDELIDALPVHVKVARAAQLFQWSRDWIRRQILAEKGSMSEQRLKLEVALRMYGHEETTRRLIEKVLSDVSS